MDRVWVTSMQLPFIAYNCVGSSQPSRLLRSFLYTHGAAVIRGFPDSEGNEVLLQFGKTLGRVQQHSTKSTPYARRANLSTFVYLIEAKPDSMHNKQGQLILSSTSDEFPCHTDEYFLQEPATIVILLCCVPDRTGGGVAYLANVEDIVERLCIDYKKRLQAPLYPHPDGCVPILSRVEGRWRIRYNCRYMKGLIERHGVEIGKNTAAALAQLEAVIESVRIEIMLRTADCLVINNYRVLHGRTAFDPTSGRRLKRIRILQTSE